MSSLLLIVLPSLALAQFGDYKPPAPKCAPFTCPAGEKPMRKKGYKTWSYGCPDSGANFLSMADLNPNDPLSGMKKNQKNFDKCCLEHDACLQTCGMSSKACHEVYEKCSAKVCKGDKNCGFQAQLATMMNAPYSPDYSKSGKDDEPKSDPLCTSYDRLQEESCECVAEDAWQETFEKRLKTFYKTFNKEKLGSDGEIKDLDQVKSKWGGKESEMFLELTKKYKDKAIERRIKPKPPPYTPPDKDSDAEADKAFEEKSDFKEQVAKRKAEKAASEDKAKAKESAESEAQEESTASAEARSGFKASLEALNEKKAKAVDAEDYDQAAVVVDEIKELKKVEVERLRAAKQEAIDNEEYMTAKALKREIEALDPKQEL